MRSRRGVRIAAVVAAVVVLLAAAGFVAARYYGVDAVRDVVVQRLEAATGREVTIAGDFDLALALAPTVIAEGITIGNAPWGSQPAMLKADRFEVELQAWPLLRRGDVLIDRLAIAGVEALLETNAEGEGNWTFGAEVPEETAESPRREFILSDLAVADSQIIYRDGATGRTETVLVDRFVWRADGATGELTLSGGGRYRERPFTVAGDLGPIADLIQGEDPYPVDLEATFGDLEATVAGQLSPDMAPEDIRLDVALAGERLADLSDLLGQELPPLGPYRLEATIAGDEAGGLAAAPLRATVGDAEAAVLVEAEGRVADVLAAEGVDLAVEAEGASLAAVGELFGVELPALGPYAATGRLTGSAESLTLAELTGSLGEEGALRARVTAGRIEGLPGAAEVDVGLAVEGPSVAALGELFGTELPALGPYAAEGRLTGTVEGLTLSGLSGRVGPEGALQVRVTEGEVADLLGERLLGLALEADGPSLAALGELFGAELPDLGPYEVEATLTGSPDDALTLTGLSGVVGEEGGVVVRVPEGEVEDVLAGQGIRVRVEAAGPALAALAAYAGVEMESFGPFEAEATVAGSLDGGLAVQDLAATAGDEASRVSVTGAIARLLEAGGLDLKVAAEGTELAALSPLLGMELPPSEPYRVAAHVAGSMEELLVEDIDVELADSSVRGWLTMEQPETDAPPRIEGELASPRLDLDRVLALAEGAGAEDGEEPNPEAEAEAEPGDEAGGVFPETPLPLDALDAFEADLALRADVLVTDATELQDVRLGLTLQDGRLGIRDLSMRIAGGEVEGDVAVDPNEAESAATVRVRLNADGIDVRDLLTEAGATDKVIGQVDLDIDLDSTGRSIDDLMDELEGGVTVAAEEGAIEDRRLEWLVPDLDILKVLPFFWGRGGNQVRVNCLVGEFDVDEGVAETDALMDTRRMALLGEGTVDLGQETLDVRLRPVAKGQKLSQAAVPIDIEGDLASPEVDPQVGATAAQAVKGVLGGLLVPLNQLAAVFGKDTASACTDALRQARERAAARDGGGEAPATATQQ